MATDKQIAANRANALKSTGPRTPEGKATCSQNASRHHRLAESTLYASENAKRFYAFVERFYREFQPRGTTERNLVDTMAAARWRILRMSSLEAAGIDREVRVLRAQSTEEMN